MRPLFRTAVGPEALVPWRFLTFCANSCDCRSSVRMFIVSGRRHCPMQGRCSQCVFRRSIVGPCRSSANGGSGLQPNCRRTTKNIPSDRLLPLRSTRSCTSRTIGSVTTSTFVSNTDCRKSMARHCAGGCPRGTRTATTSRRGARAGGNQGESIRALLDRLAREELIDDVVQQLRLRWPVCRPRRASANSAPCGNVQFSI